MNYVIAAENERYVHIIKDLKSLYLEDEFFLINSKELLNYENLTKLKPKYIFFPHWSYIISEELYKNFECVIFHMTDLPFGRGGSPLQNLIEKEIYETKISALKCVKEVDAGPIYLKKDFYLYGNAEEIYIRASKIIHEMIKEIISNTPTPLEQEGTPIIFKRRKSKESNIQNLKDLNKIYDFIRMLDAEGYPKAFIETEFLKFEFSRASFKSSKIIADVEIKLKKDINE